ncbi:MAG: hypothetical protein ACRYHA_33930 [Janthinobacterium lividum]
MTEKIVELSMDWASMTAALGWALRPMRSRHYSRKVGLCRNVIVFHVLSLKSHMVKSYTMHIYFVYTLLEPLTQLDIERAGC